MAITDVLEKLGALAPMPGTVETPVERSVRAEFGELPRIDRQQNWRFAMSSDKNPELRLMDGGGRVYRWKMPKALDARAQTMPIPLQRGTDMDASDFEVGTDSKGVMQVHRSDPKEVYATFQHGRQNLTFHLVRGDNDEWYLIPRIKRPSPKPQELAMQVIENAEKTGGWSFIRKMAGMANIPDPFRAPEQVQGVMDQYRHEGQNTPSTNPGAASATYSFDSSGGSGQTPSVNPQAASAAPGGTLAQNAADVVGGGRAWTLGGMAAGAVGAGRILPRLASSALGVGSKASPWGTAAMMGLDVADMATDPTGYQKRMSNANRQGGWQGFMHNIGRPLGATSQALREGGGYLKSLGERAGHAWDKNRSYAMPNTPYARTLMRRNMMDKGYSVFQPQKFGSHDWARRNYFDWAKRRVTSGGPLNILRSHMSESAGPRLDTQAAIGRKLLPEPELFAAPRPTPKPLEAIISRKYNPGTPLERLFL